MSNAAATPVESIGAAYALKGRSVPRDRSSLVESVAFRSGATVDDTVIGHFETAQTRDAYLSQLMLAGDSDCVASLITAAQAMPCDDRRVADLCGTLAVLAYRHGDGALAQVAADRALAANPRHILTMLILHVMAMGMPPASLDWLV